MIKVEDIPEDKFIAYDVETKGVYAPYCELIMIGYQVGINGKPELVDPSSKESCDKFRKLVNDPKVFKVSYNGINFDDIVLWQHGYFVNPSNRHDMYLALKTIHPTFPNYSLKFVNYWIDRDHWKSMFHYPEQEMVNWLQHHYQEYIHEAPIEKVGPYCMHDVTETVNVFRAVWEKVQDPQHWRPYTTLEIAMGAPLHEMMLLGRELVDTEDVKKRLKERIKFKKSLVKFVCEKTHGRVPNIGSNKQSTDYMSEEFHSAFIISEAGNRLARKGDWLRIEEEVNREPIEMLHVKRHPGAAAFEQNLISNKLEIHSDLTLNELLDMWDSTNKKEREIAFAKTKREINDLTKVIGYLRSYLYAGAYERRWRARVNRANSEGKDGKFHAVNFAVGFETGRIRDKRNKVQRDKSEDTSLIWIPKSYGLSAAKTRRFRSSSKFSYKVRRKDNGKIREIKFGINWQNQYKRSKIVQLVPRGWLGFWLDSTQIENVVHIWASDDDDRRRAYEADPYWNEYVWLSNMILGENLDRAKLDKKDSTVNPEWSVYKQYKTIKLALNFGMGPDKFAKNTGLDIKDAIKEFNKVHKACPAIKRLQGIVREAIQKPPYWVVDPFGHIYSGNKEEAYKIVAYLVQGCGTGSVPKAMTVANYKTLHQDDSSGPEPLCYPYIKHPYTGRYSYGVLCGTTHDECAGRISLGLSMERILLRIKELLYNMEGRFSKLFATDTAPHGIPLRAKLAVSLTNAANQEELDHHKDDFEEKLKAYVTKGKKDYEG